MRFEELKLIEPLQRAVREQGYDSPTPIQEQTIPPLLEGRDVMGCAQTGTGKTAAFSLPILQKLHCNPTKGMRKTRVLVLAPTRELALQIAESFDVYGHYTQVTTTVIFGGVGQTPQVQALRHGVDVLVATPGRLIDLMGQGHVRLTDVDTLVLDEADRMLDMGFVRDVRRIVAALPKQRQTMLFSATLAPDVVELAAGMLRDPVHVAVTPQATTVEKIVQSVYFVEKNDKKGLLEHMLRDPAIARAIVFTRTKHGADKVVRNLVGAGIDALALHGNKSQSQRVRALDAFKDGTTRVLVATDIAARGIDVDGITHVFNHDLPNIPDSYVHRIGRTARAGAEGIAVSFCDSEERAYLRDIERLIRQPVPVADAGQFRSSLPPPQQRSAPSSGSRPDGQRQGQRNDRPEPRRPELRPPQRDGRNPARYEAAPRPPQGEQRAALHTEPRRQPAHQQPEQQRQAAPQPREKTGQPQREPGTVVRRQPQADRPQEPKQPSDLPARADMWWQ